MIRSGVVSAASATSDAGLSAIKSTVIRAQVPLTIQVQLDPLSGCGACSASGGCGVQLLPVAQAPLFVDCELPTGAVVSIGDRVQVQIAEPSSGWLHIVARAYGSPTLGMISGSLAGYWSALALQMPQFTESFSFAGLVIGLAGGLIAWCRAEKSLQMRYLGDNRLQVHKVIQER